MIFIHPFKFMRSGWQKTFKDNRKTIKKQVENFNKLLLLLLKIQDYYFPEIRSDKRVSEFRDYNGANAIEGTFFVTKSNVLLNYIQKRRKELIKNGHFNPLKVLSESKFTIEEIKNWTRQLSSNLKNFDPLESWCSLIQYIDYSKRQKLKGNALLAQDFYEIADILFLFLEDLGEDLSKQGVSDVSDWLDLSSRDEKTKLPNWKEKKYGTELLYQPRQMLEFLCNEYRINPKPRAIIFTEGDEWKAIKKVFDFYGYKTELLEIEFRSISGEGNFSLANWQCFIEYMHEKQVLIYFLLDNDTSRITKEAKKLFKAKRKFDFPQLRKVIPQKDRIIIWGKRKKISSFEEVNFTNSDIKKAFIKQDIIISTSDIDFIKKNSARRKGLIEAIKDGHSIENLNKPQLDKDLVNIVLEKRRKKPDIKYKTPLENFVIKTGKIILLNHQPTGKHHQKMNFDTGLMG